MANKKKQKRIIRETVDWGTFVCEPGINFTRRFESPTEDEKVEAMVKEMLEGVSGESSAITPSLPQLVTISTVETSSCIPWLATYRNVVTSVKYLFKPNKISEFVRRYSDYNGFLSRIAHKTIDWATYTNYIRRCQKADMIFSFVGLLRLGGWAKMSIFSFRRSMELIKELKENMSEEDRKTIKRYNKLSKKERKAEDNQVLADIWSL